MRQYNYTYPNSYHHKKIVRKTVLAASTGASGRKDADKIHSSKGTDIRN
jgi:hypothetical protein